MMRADRNLDTLYKVLFSFIAIASTNQSPPPHTLHTTPPPRPLAPRQPRLTRWRFPHASLRAACRRAPRERRVRRHRHGHRAPPRRSEASLDLRHGTQGRLVAPRQPHHLHRYRYRYRCILRREREPLAGWPVHAYPRAASRHLHARGQPLRAAQRRRRQRVARLGAARVRRGVELLCVTHGGHGQRT